MVAATRKRDGRALNVQGPAGASVALDVGGELMVLRVARSRIVGTADTPLGFASADCTGAAYASASALALGLSLTAVVLTNPDGMAYVGDPGASPERLDSRSAYLSDVNGTGRCDAAGLIRVDDAISVTPRVALYDLFTPPFHLAAASVLAVASTTPTPPATSTPTAVAASATSTPTVLAEAACCGDCDGSGMVTVDEVITGVNHVLRGCR